MRSQDPRYKRGVYELKIALGGKCMRCGYNKYLEILHIHHIKREKRREPLKRSKIFREWVSGGILPKNVELLCPTCHYEIHFIKKTDKINPA